MITQKSIDLLGFKLVNLLEVNNIHKAIKKLPFWQAQSLYDKHIEWRLYEPDQSERFKNIQELKIILKNECGISI